MTSSEQESYAQNKARVEELNQRRARIRELNDKLRKDHVGGFITITPGISSLGTNATGAIVKLVAEFDAFEESNDPYHEHDLGSVRYDTHQILWKIDYYDKQLEWGSPDAADPDVTARVLTIMLVQEY